ncbi:MAG TPA: TMEM175 family protein [Roseiarcus sp.]|nr:TMEM175 family protein [Roseiarcus sp.]
MATIYNRLAGRDLGRIAALSDGIFAFAMTLLVLEIRIPERADVHSEAELWAGLVALAPRIVTWLMSLMTLGIFWLGQQTQLGHLARADRNLSWLYFVFLAVITAFPFSTRLLAEYFTFRVAFFIYWGNILLAGLALLACLIYEERAGLMREDVTPEVKHALGRRIVFAQALYAVGAALGLMDVAWGVGFIILVQLNYAIAPRLPFLYKV